MIQGVSPFILVYCLDNHYFAFHNYLIVLQDTDLLFIFIESDKTDSWSLVRMIKQWTFSQKPQHNTEGWKLISSVKIWKLLTWHWISDINLLCTDIFQNFTQVREWDTILCLSLHSQAVVKRFGCILAERGRVKRGKLIVCSNLR